MPSLGAFLRGGRSKKPPSDTSSAPNPPERRQSSSLPPQARVQRTYSIGSVASLSMFRRKDNRDWDTINQTQIKSNAPPTPDYSDDGDLVVELASRRPSRYTLNPKPTLHSPSTSATNGLAALRISTPDNLSHSKDTPRPSNISRSTDVEKNTLDSRPESPLSPVYSASPQLSTPDSSSPRIAESKPVFLSLPNSDSDTFNVNIDFTKFETTKVELPPKSQPTSKRITNHDFLFLVDDGPGIDHRAWDTICDLVHGVSKRLIPHVAKDASQLFDLPPENPTISIRFINNHRHISRITNLTQVRNTFKWVTPRDTPKYNRHHPMAAQKGPAHIPPLRILEYYFWNLYNEKLQKNAWVGRNPTTIVLFTSSPLGNRPEDMDLFVAKCAEKLNGDQVPLPLISILVVQCNTDPILHRQLVDTRRMITWEWYTPKPKLNAAPANTRRSRGSMMNSPVVEPKPRPQRDWVDIVTCVDWERAGGLSAIKSMIEEEIRKGTEKRKRLQREVAMNYLSNLGKETINPAPQQQTPQQSPLPQNDNDDDYDFTTDGYPDIVRTSPRQTDKYSPEYTHHSRGTESLGILPAGRGIQYYD
jgi:hypothetical protein